MSFSARRRENVFDGSRAAPPRPAARWRDGGQHVVAGRALGSRAGAFEGRVPVRRTLTRLRILRTRSLCSSSVICDAARFAPTASPRDDPAACDEKCRGVKNRGLWRPTSASAMGEAGLEGRSRRGGPARPVPVPPRRARDGARGASGIEPRRRAQPATQTSLYLTLDDPTSREDGAGCFPTRDPSADDPCARARAMWRPRGPPTDRTEPRVTPGPRASQLVAPRDPTTRRAPPSRKQRENRGTRPDRSIHPRPRGVPGKRKTHAGSVSIVSSEEPRFHRRSSGFIGDRERVHRSNRPRVPNVPVRSKPVVRSRPVVQKTRRHQSHARAGHANGSSLPPSLASLITSSSS